MQTITGVFGVSATDALRALELSPSLSGPGFALSGPTDGPLAVSGGPEGARAEFDPTTSTGTLSRDRMGRQNLFILRHPERVWFSTDLNVLLRVPGTRARLNLEALHHYLSYQEVPAPLTLFAGLSRLAPGHRQLWRDGRLPSPERYASLNWSSPAEASEAEYAERVLQELRQALARRPGDAFLLSGEAVSSLLVALAAESGRPLQTYTLQGHGHRPEEARQLARHYGTTHHEIPSLPLEEVLEKQTAFYGEPGVRPLLWLREALPEVVCGLGARALLGSTLVQELSAQSDSHEDWLQRYQLLTFTDEEKERLYNPRMLEELQGYSSLQLLKRRYSHLSATDPWNRALEADLGAFNSWNHLAHGLYCPFLDEQVSQLMAAAPTALKRSQTLLARLGGGRVPNSTLLAEPVQPAIPVGLVELSERWLSAGELEKSGLFSPASVRRLQERTRALDARAGRQLLTLLSFQCWHRSYLEAPALV